MRLREERPRLERSWDIEVESDLPTGGTVPVDFILAELYRHSQTVRAGHLRNKQVPATGGFRVRSKNVSLNSPSLLPNVLFLS